MSKKVLSVLLSLLLTLSLVIPAAGAAPSSIELKQALSPEEALELKRILDERALFAQSPVLDESLENVGSGPVSVIVELSEEPVALAKGISTFSGRSFTSLAEARVEAQVQKQQESFESSLNANDIDFEIHNQYSHAFNGVALEVDGSQVEDLLEIPGVLGVYPDLEVELDPRNEINPHMKDTGPFIGAPEVWDLGYKGAGIKVGVIDTGIDYNHPNLMDAYKGGYDFVDNDNDPYEATPLDWENDPENRLPVNANGRTFWTDHGTHVAGTIAAREAGEYGVVGIAPEAEIYAYRVLGPYGSGYSSWVLGGIDRSVEDGMDVINLSLGNSRNDPDYITSVALNNAALAGVVPVVSAGNSGPVRWTLGSPGSSAFAITVGNSTGPSDQITATSYFFTEEDPDLNQPQTEESKDPAELGQSENIEPAIKDAGTSSERVSAEEESPSTGQDGVLEDGVTDRAAGDGEAQAADSWTGDVSEAGTGTTVGASDEKSSGFTEDEGSVGSRESTLSGAVNTVDEAADEVAATAIAPNAAPVNVIAATYEIDFMAWNLADDPANVLQGDFELVFAGLGSAENFENIDAKGKIALIERGAIPFVEKIEAARVAGAAGAIIYNNVDESVSPVAYLGDSFFFIPTARMTKQDGEQIKALLAANPGLKVQFSNFHRTQTEGDEINSSSSRGPAKKTLDIKPDVVAPGTSILSSIPAYGRDYPDADYSQAYDRFTGTSMAAPHVAGLAALMVEKHRDWTPFDVKVALMNNAKVLDTALYDVVDQGAGRVQALNTLQTEALVKVMDTTFYEEYGVRNGHENITGSISFGNFTGSTAKTVIKKIRVEQLGAAGAGKYTVDVSTFKETPGVSVTVDKPSFMLNGQEELIVTIEVPEGISGVSEHQGTITLTNGTRTYSVPFAAFFNLEMTGIKYTKVFSDTETYLPHLRLDKFGELDKLTLAFEFYNPMEIVAVDLDDNLNPDSGVKGDGVIGRIFGAMGSFSANTPYHINWNGKYIDNTTEEEVEIEDGLYSIKVSSLGTNLIAYGDETPMPFFVKRAAPVIHAEKSVRVSRGSQPSLTGAIDDLYVTSASVIQNSWALKFDVSEWLDANYIIKRGNQSVVKQGSFDVEQDGTFSIALDGLANGNYTVELSVKDRQGLEGKASVSVQVTGAPNPPSPGAPGGGGGGGSSSGGGASTPTPAPAPGPSSERIGDAKVTETKNADGSVSAVVELLEDQVTSKLAGDGENVSLDVSKVDFAKYSEFALTLSKSAVDKLKESKKSLAITGPGFTLTLPVDSLDDFAVSSGGLKLSAAIAVTPAGSGSNLTTVTPAFTLKHEGELAQSILLTLHYDPASVKDARKVGVYTVSAKGALEYTGLPHSSARGKVSIWVSSQGSYVAAESAVTFNDISGHWAQEEIEIAAAHHITQGTGAGKFSPSSTVTRAEFATLLDRIFATGISWETRSQEPGARSALSREEMVVMIAEALEADLGGGQLSFQDAGSISPDARGAVAFAVNHGLVKGMNGNRFAPEETSTRAQVSIIVYRLLEYLDKI